MEFKVDSKFSLGNCMNKIKPHRIVKCYIDNHIKLTQSKDCGKEMF